MSNIVVKEKHCPDCNRTLDSSMFSRNRSRHDGLQSVCKSCLKDRGTRWRHSKNPPKKKELLPVNHKKCTKCNNVLHKESFNKQNNGFLGKRGSCRSCDSKTHKVWRDNGGREWDNNYKKYRKDTDPIYKLKYITRLRVNEVLKRSNITKRHSGIVLLGCSLEEYKSHLESKFYKDSISGEMMSWKNHGIIWEVDHIIPLATAKNEKELLSLFHYSNTQPLTISENRSKGSFF